jgi:hypothetical protein
LAWRPFSLVLVRSATPRLHPTPQILLDIPVSCRSAWNVVSRFHSSGNSKSFGAYRKLPILVDAVLVSFSFSFHHEHGRRIGG